MPKYFPYKICGILKDHEITKIQKFIKSHYLEMYQLWAEDSKMGFYNN